MQFLTYRIKDMTTGLNGALLLLSVGLGLLTGCVASAPKGGDGVIKQSQQAGRISTEQLLPVDCLLPAQIRKLGAKMTYLAARRAIKTTASDCEIRGGEYVAFDRADYRTSLTVWLDRAKQGDPEAQTYVGEIYEKGLGLPKDYKTAKVWYAKAADQGYSRAQINLGYLYEKGLGVAQDKVTALNWYRRASGVSKDDIDYSSAIEVKAATLAEEQTEVLRQEVNRRKREVKALKVSLSSAKQQLKAKKSELNESKKRLDQLKKKIDNTSDKARLDNLKQEYLTQKSEIDRLDKLLRTSEKKAQSYQQALASKSAAIEQQKKMLASQSVSGPSIEVFDPSVAITRGGEPEVLLRSGSKVRIVSGKIQAPAGLQAATINGKSLSLDPNGIFRSVIPVSEKRQRVTILAKDARGKQAEFAFLLIPSKKLVIDTADSKQVSRVAGSIDFGRYYALVIGNNEYSSFPTLKTAVNDARKVAQVLKNKYGFNTLFVENGDRHTILSALNDIKRKLTDKDNLLIYYAGHGERDIGTLQGYWLPVDAEQDNTANWIPNATISALLETMKAKHILVVADSCYSGSMTRSSVARLDTQLNDANLKKWLKVMSRTPSRTALTSGGVAPVLDSGGGSHSVFAQAFIGELEGASGPIDAYKIYLRVTREVQKNAGLKGFEQTPTYAPIKFTGHSGGEFIFVKG